MRKILGLFVFVALASIIVISCSKDQQEDVTPQNKTTEIPTRDNSVWICHKPDGNHPHAIWVDESAVAAHLGHGDELLDADGDGYTAYNNCGEGSMDDCDDSDPNVNPGVAEVPYDGIDNDCNPATPDDDLDGDGYLLVDDCDDTDASVNPGAEEVCGDGIDNNCDGQIDENCGNCAKTDFALYAPYTGVTDVGNGIVLTRPTGQVQIVYDFNAPGEWEFVVFWEVIDEGCQAPLLPCDDPNSCDYGFTITEAEANNLIQQAWALGFAPSTKESSSIQPLRINK